MRVCIGSKEKLSLLKRGPEREQTFLDKGSRSVRAVREPQKYVTLQNKLLYWCVHASIYIY